MSKIDLKDELDDVKPKRKLTLLQKRALILLGVALIFGIIINNIIVDTVKIPFNHRNSEIAVTQQEVEDVSLAKIAQVKRSFLQIRTNSFWDHENYTDINYSNKTIALAVNNIYGYNAKKQVWNYSITTDNQTQIVEVEGITTLNNVKYKAKVSYELSGKDIFFYNLQLKEYRSRRGYTQATDRQKSMMIQKMYRG